MALSGGLAGHHPPINCMDGMVRCNVGIAKLNYIDNVSHPSKCPYSLDSRRLSPAHISDVTGGKVFITVAPRFASPIGIQVALSAFKIKICVSGVKLGVSQFSWAVA